MSATGTGASAEFDPATISWVTDESDLDFLLLAIDTARHVVFDLETTGLDEHAITGGRSNGGVSARIVLATFTLPQPDDAGEPTTYVLPLSHPDSPWIGAWRAVMTRVAEGMVGRSVIGHHVKFDARWVYAITGVDLSTSITWDTMDSSYLLDEGQSKSLKHRASVTFGIDRWDDHDLSYPGAAEDVPLMELGVYGCADTYWSWRLAEHHRSQMFVDTEPGEEPVGPDEVEDARLGVLAQHVSMPTVASLAIMEQHGVALDMRWVRAAIQRATRDRDEITDRLTGLYPSVVEAGGTPSFSPSSSWFHAWTRAAVEAGDLRVAAMTPKGKPQWSQSVLTRQAREGSEVADDLLLLRKRVKQLEYLTSWQEKVSPEERIHATYNSTSTRSGRTSSSSPNMQQVSAVLKPAFVPDRGYYLAEIDFSQIEMRVAAFVSRCQPMIEAFRRGDDLHRLFAAKIAGKDPEDVTPQERQAAKAGNFGLLFYMSATGFREYAETAYGVMLTEEEAARIHAAFFETWDGIGQWHLYQMKRARDTGQSVSPLGRVRRLPDVWDENEYYASAAERQSINSPVQSFASDLTQAAAASISGVLPGTTPVGGARVVGTVHDSILIEVPRDRWESVTKECRDRMVTIGDALREPFGIDLDVPLDAEGKIGTRWGLADVGEV